MTGRWPLLPRLGGTLLLAALTACSDGALTAPDTPAAPDAVYDLAAGRGFKDGGRLAKPHVTTFEYLPWAPTIARIAGEHTISFSQWAVCDPATSGYSPSLWDAPCAPARGPITITARSWHDAQGHPHIEFTPALRFAPGRLVMLFVRDRDAAADPSFTILYCDEAGRCVDESLTDPSVATHRNLASGVLFRRIKHFSSYNVAAE